MSRFTLSKRTKPPREPDRPPQLARPVTLTCGCSTRVVPAVTLPGGRDRYWCGLHKTWGGARG